MNTFHHIPEDFRYVPVFDIPTFRNVRLIPNVPKPVLYDQGTEPADVLADVINLEDRRTARVAEAAGRSSIVNALQELPT